MAEFQRKMKPVSRRSFIKQSAKLTFGLFAAMTLTGTYSYKIERFWYQIKEVPLRVKNLPAAFQGFKIVQFSDVHLGFHYGVDNFRTVVKMINRINPDIIFFTGDLIQIGNRQPELAIPLLKELKALPGGKWAVIGNHDFYTKEDVTRVLETANFKVLNNEHGVAELDGEKIYIAGIDDVMYGNPDVGKATEGLSDKDCVLLLAHEPDIADESSRHPVSAQFSGHSHGGQVRIPLLGPIIKQNLARKYEDGYYDVGENHMVLYVNRGIGTTDLAIRFFCRPEITVFKVT